MPRPSTKDGRKDEANILKAKLNIFDVCKSVFEALFKQHPEGIETVFPATFERITAPWEASLSKAKEHGDDRKVLIEEAKLSAVTEINARFAELS